MYLNSGGQLGSGKRRFICGNIMTNLNYVKMLLVSMIFTDILLEPQCPKSRKEFWLSVIQLVETEQIKDRP